MCLDCTHDFQIAIFLLFFFWFFTQGVIFKCKTLPSFAFSSNFSWYYPWFLPGRTSILRTLVSTLSDFETDQKNFQNFCSDHDSNLFHLLQKEAPIKVWLLHVRKNCLLICNSSYIVRLWNKISLDDEKRGTQGKQAKITNTEYGKKKKSIFMRSLDALYWKSNDYLRSKNSADYVSVLRFNSKNKI